MNAKSGSERYSDWVARKRDKGCKEVRGIFCTPTQCLQIKTYAKRLLQRDKRKEKLCEQSKS